MKGVLEIEAKVLRAALADVAGAVEARNTIPILSNVLLSVGRHQLSIEATDLDIWVQRHVAVEAGDAFSFTAEASTLRRVVDKLPAGAMCTLQVVEGTLTIKAGRSKFTLPTLPADDFPNVAAKDWSAEFEIPALTFGAAIGRVASAISTEETRYYLNGVYLEAREAELIAVATDGHRLSRTRLPLPDGAETLAGSILPRKVVKLLDPLLGRHEGSIDVRVCASRIRFEIGETTIDAKLIDGTFPDYMRVIPTHHDRRLSIEREALVAALGRVITVSSDKQRVVKAELDRDRLVLSVSSPEKGQGSEELPCDYTDAPLTIGFNTRFLLDALSEIDGDVIEGLFTDAEGPALWRFDDRAASTFVIMPLRV